MSTPLRTSNDIWKVLMKDWKFEDPPNVAVLSDKSIFKRGDWIAYVLREDDNDDDDDDEGGSWQFYSSDTRDRDESDIMLVGLQEVIARDESILALADLPKGWHAWRNSKSAPWQRAKSHPTRQRQRMNVLALMLHKFSGT